MSLTPELLRIRDEAREAALEFGLDFPEVVFELVDSDELNMIASYGGFPVRYPHWRFGMEYRRLQKTYEYGMGKIYELVINTDPSYAYLLSSNMLVDQKLVMAHVYGTSTSSRTTTGSARRTGRCSTRWPTTPRGCGAT